jgi:hypothetical protein
MTLKKPVPPLERYIEKKACEFAESLGYEHIKLDDSKRKWPDRLFLGPRGQILFVEFKREGEKPRPQQEAFHYRLGRMFHKVHVIDTLEDFKILLTNAPPRAE